jgi:hypothetical protein
MTLIDDKDSGNDDYADDANYHDIENNMMA